MKAVIFDMDGVIFDSETAVLNGWKEIAEKYGIPDVEIPYRLSIGSNAEMSKKNFLEYYGEDFPYDIYKEEQRANFHKKYDGGKLPLKPGVCELLTYIKEKGMKTAVASSTRFEMVKAEIEAAGLDIYFDVIIGGDHVKKSKPHPEIFLKAAELLSVSLQEAYIIEDSFNGIRAAFSAGAVPVMVPDMQEPDDEMKSKAWKIAGNLFDVIELIEEDEKSQGDNTVR
ncbi:MAG: HAD family hydrolase [Ruminococcus sp.]